MRFFLKQYVLLLFYRFKQNIEVLLNGEVFPYHVGIVYCVCCNE